MFLAALLVALGAVAHLEPVHAGGLAVSDAYARATIAAAKTGAIYLRIVNSGEADRLRAAATPAAERAELHLHKNENGVMSMAPVGCLGIPADGTVTFAPGSLHVMLFGLKSPLVEGSEIALTLTFDKAGEVNVKVPVRGIAAGAGAGGEHGHDLETCD
jgi:copper(I)-binding protein